MKIDNYVIIASLKNEPNCKLINRIQKLRLLISSLLGSASRTHVKLHGMPRNSTSVFKSCLVNLILKDAPVVFSISRIYKYNLYQTTYTGIATYPFSLCFLSRLLVNSGPFFGDDGDIFDFSDSPTVDNGVPFDFLCKLVGVPTSTICIFPLLPNVFRNESINLAPSLGFDGMETPNISQLFR